MRTGGRGSIPLSIARRGTKAVPESQPRFATVVNSSSRLGKRPVLEDPNRNTSATGSATPVCILAIDEKKFESLFVVRPPTRCSASVCKPKQAAREKVSVRA
jgi:hypothetical protein